MAQNPSLAWKQNIKCVHNSNIGQFLINGHVAYDEYITWLLKEKKNYLNLIHYK